MADRFPVVRMQRLQELIEVSPSVPYRDGMRLHLVGGQHFVPNNVPFPITESGGARGQAHPRLVPLQLPGQLHRAQCVAAQLVTHGGDGAQGRQTRHDGPADHFPKHQRCLHRCRNHEENHAAAYNQRAPPVTMAPGGKRGVHNKDQQEQIAGLAHQHPVVPHAIGDGDGFPQEWDVAQAGDFPVVEIGRECEIENQRQGSHAADGPRQPQPSGPQIEPHEADERNDEHQGRHMDPAQQQTVGFRRVPPASWPARNPRSPPSPPRRWQTTNWPGAPAADTR